MKLDRYTEKAQEAILAAQRLATEADSPILDAEHILAALLSDAEGIPALTLRQLGADPAQVNVELAAVLSRRAKIEGGQMALDARAKQLVERAEDEARAAAGRIRFDRAPFARRRRERRRRAAHPRGGRRRARADPDRAPVGSRRPARHQPEPRGHLPGARALRARPDARRARGQARSGDRPRRGDPARDPGPVAPNKEQPGADR